MTKSNTAIYGPGTWNTYARYFFGVTTSFQLDLYREAARHSQGNVIDLGCGTAKLAPIVLDNPSVNSYTGIDASETMISLAQQLSELFGRERFNLIHGEIESLAHQRYASGVSINSYYSWPDPAKTLAHIYDVLEDGAIFVMATPNDKLNMPEILYQCEKELIGHPYFEIFKQMNLSLAENDDAGFLAMDALIRQIQHAGFRVQNCNQSFYADGMNFLVAAK
ncbi:MAG: class I SAM-dependent methyltransferase [Nitrosomonas sp.]|nr:class I SAM-dependent methyltransferase [Nitrosomonas sp.]MCW5607002.1 class I SAM-dependent methyltransferase [Nitrosomonas sp.]